MYVSAFAHVLSWTGATTPSLPSVTTHVTPGNKGFSWQGARVEGGGEGWKQKSEGHGDENVTANMAFDFQS